jgi:DNA-binding CsgD family transcriptional regulator
MLEIFVKGGKPMNARDELTKQERIVLAFVAQGWRTAKIAEALFISPRTVETHLAHIFQKLGVTSRTEAAVYALQANLTPGTKIRTNPDDARNDKLYAYGNELSDSTRTRIKEEIA